MLYKVLYSIALSRKNSAILDMTRYTRVYTVLAATKHEPCLPLLPSRRALPPFGRYSLCLPTEGWQARVELADWLD